jgi:hypothetical protein
MNELVTKIIAKARELCKNTCEQPNIEEVINREAHIKLIKNKETGGYKIQCIKFIGIHEQVTVTETWLAYKPDQGCSCELYTYPNWNTFLNLKVED